MCKDLQFYAVNFLNILHNYQKAFIKKNSKKIKKIKLKKLKFYKIKVRLMDNCHKIKL